MVTMMVMVVVMVVMVTSDSRYCFYLALPPLFFIFILFYLFYFFSYLKLILDLLLCESTTLQNLLLYSSPFFGLRFIHYEKFFRVVLLIFFLLSNIQALFTSRSLPPSCIYLLSHPTPPVPVFVTLLLHLLKAYSRITFSLLILVLYFTHFSDLSSSYSQFPSLCTSTAYSEPIPVFCRSQKSIILVILTYHCLVIFLVSVMFEL